MNTRAQQCESVIPHPSSPAIKVTLRDGKQAPLNMDKVNRAIEQACEGLPGVLWPEIATRAQIDWYDGISTTQIDESVVLCAANLIEKHPDYAYAAARLRLRVLYQDVFGARACRDEGHRPGILYRRGFRDFLIEAVVEGRLDPRLTNALWQNGDNGFDIGALSKAIQPERDRLFQLQGVDILADRYLLRRADQSVIELPQWLWMRVAMGLAISESEEIRTEMAIRFYDRLSTFCYIPSTPTLFNAGMTIPQLTSCFLHTVEDSREGIFKAYDDMSALSKFAGGIGTDWTPVRGTGSHIRGTNGRSQGVIPWLRIQNDIAIAVNQGGKRQGAHCAYLETWHIDIEAFLDLRKNVGDERRRTPDMQTANWIPDLFMKRVRADDDWTLFSPSDVPELHETHGSAFNEAYRKAEADFDDGKIPGKRIAAKQLWKKMLQSVFETGHPWMTWKDACNGRSPQQHQGAIHSSNLCTEITLNSSLTETASCNIGSVNLAAHVEDGKLQWDKLTDTIRLAVRMLDNVISVAYYPTKEARTAADNDRSIGLGVMGYQDVLYQLGMRFDSQAHVEFADRLLERFSYDAIESSMLLARQRGCYPTYAGSLWSKGVFPLDTLGRLGEARGVAIDVDLQSSCEWDELKKEVSRYGMRNANVMAIAPTATISNIAGVSASIEPTFRNLYTSSNLSGEFVVLNAALVKELESRGLWCEELAEVLKAVDGEVSRIAGLPEDIKDRYRTAFELDQSYVIQAAAARGKWIDQSQSLNLYARTTSGKVLNALYMQAWSQGLKTTYYLRTLSASQVEKVTVDTAKHGKTHVRQPQACSIAGDSCEACQ